MTAPGTPSTPGQGAVIIDGPGLYATADGREVAVTAQHGKRWRGHLGQNLDWWYEPSGELAGMPEHPDRIVRKLPTPTPAPSQQTVEGVAEKIERLEAELKDRDETIGRLCDDAWGHVYPGMTDWDYPDQAIRHLRQYADELKADKDSAYEERSRIVAAFARTVHVLCGWPVVVTRTAIAGWGPEWHGCVYITTPAGQVSWHFHDDHAPLFDGLPRAVRAEWDGHDTAEKYRRLDRLPGR